MASDLPLIGNNGPLILWYAIPAVIGFLLYKEKRWLGAVIGLAVALVGITVFAYLMGN